MKRSSIFSQVVRFCTAILVCTLVVALVPEQGSQVAASIPDDGLTLAQRSTDGQPRAPAQTWTRTLEPLIVSGSELPLFNGVALADLFVYAYDGSTWTVVPFQFDEVGLEDSFVPFEDGLLDADDQLVFMAADLGDKAEPYEWLANADSQSHSRYEIHVTNPLSAAQEGWVYVYHSTTLAPTFAPYVTWDGASNTIMASTYVIGLAPGAHLGMDSLRLNGHAEDVLDRSKLRLSGDCLTEDGWEHFDLTEDSEELIDSWESPDIPGPVRAGGGKLNNQSWYYASLYEEHTRFREVRNNQCERLRYDLLRISEDWRNPAASGMAPMHYFDSNTPLGVMIDGVYDQISTSLPEWRQVNGVLGSVMEVVDIDAADSEVSNYYLDLNQEDPDDTGDQRSFGDAGFRVVSPPDTTWISITHYVLDPLLINVGELYRQYYDNPLEAAATAQGFFDPTPHAINYSWSPWPVFTGVETTFTATVDGVGPFTYDWDFGDGAGVASGNVVTHTFSLSGTIPVSLSVTNDYGTGEVVGNILVWEPGAEIHLIYTPLVLRNAP